MNFLIDGLHDLPDHQPRMLVMRELYGTEPPAEGEGLLPEFPQGFQLERHRMNSYDPGTLRMRHPELFE